MKLSRKQKAIGVSLVFHAVLLTCLLFWYIPDQSAQQGAPTASQSTDSQSRPSRDQVGSDQPAEASVAQSPDIPAEQIENSVQSAIEQTNRLPDERKLTELEKNLARLESISDEHSVKQATATIAQSLGLDTDQYNSTDTSDTGTFDTDSAQIRDVTRTKDEKGSWVYETIMVDSGGREMRVQVGTNEGEQLYETFEMMERFPLAKGVYQSVVMPMMQKMLEAERDHPSNETTVIIPATAEGDTTDATN